MAEFLRAVNGTDQHSDHPWWAVLICGFLVALWLFRALFK